MLLRNSTWLQNWKKTLTVCRTLYNARLCTWFPHECVTILTIFFSQSFSNCFRFKIYFAAKFVTRRNLQYLINDLSLCYGVFGVLRVSERIYADEQFYVNKRHSMSICDLYIKPWWVSYIFRVTFGTASRFFLCCAVGWRKKQIQYAWLPTSWNNSAKYEQLSLFISTVPLRPQKCQKEEKKVMLTTAVVTERRQRRNWSAFLIVFNLILLSTKF